MVITSEGMHTAIVTGVFLLGAKLGEFWSIRFGKKVDSDTAREGQLWTRLATVEASVATGQTERRLIERECREEIDRLRAERDDYRNRFGDLTLHCHQLEFELSVRVRPAQAVVEDRRIEPGP